MNNRYIHTMAIQNLKEIFGQALVYRKRNLFYVYKGKEHPLAVKVIDVSTTGRNFNQMETLNMAIHILGMGSADGIFEWYILPVTEVARISVNKPPQHGGTKAEDFIATIDDIDSKFNVKQKEILNTVNRIIDSQASYSNYKILDARMQIERLKKESDRMNYDLFLTEFVKQL